MKKVKIFLLALCCSAFSTLAIGQSCAAAFLDGKIVVDEYTTTGKCVMANNATGQLTVQTADLSPERSIPTGKIAFRIAIKSKDLNTIKPYSKGTYRQIDVEKVLAKCQKGDSIVLMAVKDGYSLPHHEIFIQ